LKTFKYHIIPSSTISGEEAKGIIQKLVEFEVLRIGSRFEWAVPMFSI
jgi:hypothetical protein